MSQIVYTPAFARNVQAKLRARFRLDADGAPVFEGRDKLREYTIDLSLETARAAEIASVIYNLDDDTYWDPVVASNDHDNDFTEEISSYGDFEVEVTVQMRGHSYKQRAWFSSLLAVGHEGDNSPAIVDARNRLKNN